MLDMFARSDEIAIRPARKLAARVAGLYVAPGDHFQTRSTDALEITFDGIADDYHAGLTRRSGGREPWYPRGTLMRNERQISIVSFDEMDKIAAGMGLPEVKPEWLGANMAIDGLPNLSMLPGGTLLFFKGGVTIKIDGPNAPCRSAGRCVAENARMADQAEGALAFVKAAKRLRGIVAWVEKPGRIEAGEEISVRVPEQWIYEA